MRDWLDEEMEREGLTSRRSEAARLREERAAFCDESDRLKISWKTKDAEELKLFRKKSSDAAHLKKVHEENCDAKALREQHARAHAENDRRLQAMRNNPSEKNAKLFSLIIIVCILFITQLLTAALQILR